ncbi:MAG: NAD(P)H-binding protein [Bacteroidales bacterium]
MERVAIVFGSTGLVGNLLVEELVRSGKYSSVKTFVRQPTGVSESMVEEIVADLSDPANYSSGIKGDDLFICIGTTIRKAGSVSNMEKIDRDLPIEIARAASASNVKRVAVVSSIGASASSSNYYLRIKGEMEQGILSLPFDRTVIVRPSMLLGDRKERRAGEFVGKVVMKAVGPVMFGKLARFRAIHGGDVAKAMISLLADGSGSRIVESDELKKIAAL